MDTFLQISDFPSFSKIKKGSLSTIKTNGKPGNLNFTDISLGFDVKRIFTLNNFYDLLPINNKRGIHVNDNVNELIIVNKGSLKFVIYDKYQNKIEFFLNINEILYLPSQLWLEFYILEKDTDIIVLADRIYKDSISNYNFDSYVNHYIFDFDGTLIEKMNINYIKLKNELKNILKYDGELTPMYEIINKQPDSKKQECFKLIDKYEFDIIEDCKVNSKVLDIYKRMKYKIIMSRNGQCLIEHFFKNNNLSMPDFIACRDNCKNLKPHNDHLKIIFNSFSFLNKHNAVIIGDSWHDEQIAKNNSIKFVDANKI